MATLMQAGAAPIPEIDRHLLDNEPESVSDAVDRHRRAREAYSGGLTAERQSYERMAAEARRAIRAAYLSKVGRRIDLVALLRQRDQDRRPVWTVANPSSNINGVNGCIKPDGDVLIKDGRSCRVVVTGRKTHSGQEYVPSGMPALPPRVRELATDPKIRKRAAWVGVLYQPDGWTEVDPDPALVVEWEDRPGEYFALAIWGGDRAAIEEFVG